MRLLTTGKRIYNKGMKKNLLPIGSLTFSRIREENRIYVDKTARIYEMVSWETAPLFMARPRRFGKTLLCSTLIALFEGRRDLFRGLAIDSLDWEWESRPVIHIDFNIANYAGANDFRTTINAILETHENKYGVPNIASTTLCDRFLCLIYHVAEKYGKRIVLIIDEYDKPVLDTVNNRDAQQDIINMLCGLFAVIKSSDPYLQFAFLTGITEFSHETFRSNLDSLQDISLKSEYRDLCGITQAELKAYFELEITRAATENGMDRQDYLDKLGRFYGGYRFSSEDSTVYSPFGILNHIDNDGKFDARWFAADTPSFLTKLVEEGKSTLPRMKEILVWCMDFYRFSIERMDLVAALYLSGYFTIKDYHDETHLYSLDYTNDVIRSAFNSQFRA